jgi:hypothetical protein
MHKVKVTLIPYPKKNGSHIYSTVQLAVSKPEVSSEASEESSEASNLSTTTKKKIKYEN